MATTFLSRVASEIMARHANHLDRVAVVFPNKRASLFLNQELIRIAGRPIWSPAYITISELFRKQSTLTEADPLMLVTILHKVFTQVTGSIETLDDFWGWGETMLSDFDDIDKHLAEASKVLQNISDLRQLDSLDYLTSEQRQLLSRFFTTFIGHESQLQSSFAHLWSKLGEIYIKFKSELMQRRLAYEGMLYRDVVETQSYSFPYDSYIFVGFNLLQEVEEQLFRAAKQTGKAEFYWDYDHSYMADHSPFFEAGQFIKRNIEAHRFPSIIPPDDPIYHMATAKKKIDYVASPSDTLQASYVAKWLNESIETTDAAGNAITVKRYELGRRCAVVLVDESLLPSVLGSLTDEMGKRNVTLGFPLQHSPAASLVDNLISLRLEGSRQGGQELRSKHIARLLRHPYIQMLSSAISELLSQIISQKHFWWKTNELVASGDASLQLLFGPLPSVPSSAHPLASLLAWCMQVVHAVGIAAGQGDDLTLESLYRMHALLGRLQMLMANGILDIDASTMRRLLVRLVGSTSVPFHGEPAEGVQIMGVLETRNLDFEQILVLSASDQYMPKPSSRVSLIPYNVRKAFSLTVPDQQVAIYAYYFYRMIARARDITLCYNIDTDQHGQGEMSRFMMQLLIHNPQQVEMYKLALDAATVAQPIRKIDKTPAILEILQSRTTFSATSLAQYMRCPLKYYYINVLNLREPESDDDDIANTLFGTIFHYSMELIYRQLTNNLSQPTVTASQIEHFLSRKLAIEHIVDQAFAEKFFYPSQSHSASKGNNIHLPELNGMQVINHSAVCAYVRRVLQSDIATAPFRIIGLEERHLNYNITLPNGTTLSLKGSIDRLDQLTDAQGQSYLRVVDYKTGRPIDKQPCDLSQIFNLEVDHDWHPDYYLQALLYSLSVEQSTQFNPDHLPVRPALLFVSASRSQRVDPILCVDGQPIMSVEPYRQIIQQGVANMLNIIRSDSEPFTPTPFVARCQNCAFASFCKS